ncbi:MAG: methyltransferase domain-containing protein [Leptonema sp. (in: Bacteria)]|nr:methyltransferase domain-containing protein [Leptonema sp. (in: bacteria)]
MIKSTSRQLGDGITGNRWSFGGQVPEQFATHACRSIPFYEAGHKLIAKISDSFVYDGSLIYDLGCSTGQLLYLLANRHQNKKMKLIGIENEPAMIDYANQHHSHDSIQYLVDDVNQFDYGNETADLIICYYTIQFVRPAIRQLLIDRLFSALKWGGALLLFEKTRGPDARFQDLLTGLYNDFKLEQGYAADEILNKSQSLRGVLEPFSTQGNLDLLSRSGFKDWMTILKYICFEGIVAIK